MLARNGYALLTDLDGAGYGAIVDALERFQVEFLAETRGVWQPDFPIPRDALGHFTRQWEYPYAWANLGSTRGRLLDAGSGMTFLPFVFAASGFDVVCCDADEDALGYRERFAQAGVLTGQPVGYVHCMLEDLPFADGSFDAVACVSVLEHVQPPRAAIIESLARVIRPGGRLVVTCDVDLQGDGDLRLGDLADLLAEFERQFELAYPLELRRPPTLLTSESFLASSQWRLPAVWRSLNRPREEEFRTIAVLGLTGVRRGRG